MKNNLLIVGAGGSIGNFLIESIDKINNDVYVLDKQFLNENIKNIKYLKSDLLDFDSIKNLISKLPSNLLVIYLVGNLSIKFNPNEIQDSLNDNVVALSVFLNLIKSKLKYMIFVSTVSVYGIPQKNPIDENHPVNPQSLYGCSKASAEIMCKTVCQNSKIPLTILRVTQLYGLNSAQYSFPHVLLNAIKSNDFSKIKINSNLERDYLHISDFIELVLNLIDQPKQGIFNIGYGKGVNLLELTKSMSSQYKVNLTNDEIVDSNTSFSIVMDISKAKKFFNFKPKQRIDLWLTDELKFHS